MAFKPTNEGGGEQLNYAGVNKTIIEQEEMIAFMTLNVDLGIQKAKPTVSYDDGSKGSTVKSTIVDTEEEAEALIEEAIEIMGDYLADKYKIDEMPEENDDDKYELLFEIYTPKDCQQVAIFADSPECEVEYIEDQPVQYRHMFNRSYAGDISGINFKAAPPQGKSKLWTFSPKSILAELATKTGNKQIVEDGDDNMDVDQWLGAAVRLDVEEKNKYAKVTVNKVGKREVEDAEALRSDLAIEPMSILFDDEVDDLVKKLEIAQLRFGIIKLMKAATNFDGSNMQKALEIVEAAQKAAKAEETDKEESSSTKKKATKKKSKKNKKADKAEKKANKKSNKAKASKKAKRKVKPKSKKNESSNADDFDDDIPF